MDKVAMVPAGISSYAVVRGSIYEPFEGLGILQNIRRAAGLQDQFKFYETKILPVLVGGSPLIRTCVGRGFYKPTYIQIDSVVLLRLMTPIC